VSSLVVSSGSCDLHITFDPTAVASYSETLTVVYENTVTNAQHTMTLSIDGEGIPHPFDNDTTPSCIAANGDVGNEYCVYDLEELNRIRDYADKHFILTDDIPITGACNDFVPIPNFTGTLDGQGHTISDFCYSDNGVWSVGLFANIAGASAEVKNLILDDFIANGADQVGALAGVITGGNFESITVNNPTVTSQGAGNEYVDSGGGGLVGFVVGTDVTTMDTIVVNGGLINSMDCNAGGIVGRMANVNSVLSNASASATITGYQIIGGLVAYLYGGSVTDSIATGDVTATSGMCIGGFAGGTQHAVSIDNSSATGDVTAGAGWGGVAGFVGCANSAATSISNSFSTGTVNSPANSTGGFVGANGASLTFSDCYTTSNVNGGSYSGGFAGGGNGGWVSAGNFVRCYATGNVIATGDYVGGFAPESGGSITQSYATGNVTAAGNYVGSFAGANSGTITNSFSAGDVSGASYVAGFIGINTGTVTGSFASKNSVLTATGDYVGGFVGSNSGSIQDSISSLRTVASDSDMIGGFVGYNTGSISRSISLADSITSTNIGAVNIGSFLGLDNLGSITDSFYNNDSPLLADPFAMGVLSGNISNAGSFLSLSFPPWKMSDTNPHADYQPPVPEWICDPVVVNGIGGVDWSTVSGITCF
jgi:hypothetical protein